MKGGRPDVAAHPMQQAGERTMETPQEILRFWFGEGQDEAQVARDQAGLWWGKNPATDNSIRARFEALLKAALAGNLDNWAATPQGNLALIILTDQFPRNMYRDTSLAFASDPQARRWCKTGLLAARDRELRAIERVFFYLPLEHSESVDDQNQSVALFKGLAAQAPQPLRDLFEGYADFARRHRDIILRFGRFPHRNRVLGRRSSAEEISFLRKPGSSF